MQTKIDPVYFDAAIDSPPHALWRRISATICAALFMLSFATYFAQRPDYGWDMIAYMAIALRDGGTPAAAIHEQTYEALQAALPQSEFEKLIGRGAPDPNLQPDDIEFRQTAAANSDSFLAQLPYWSVKPVYPALMAVLHATGLGLIASGLAVSAAAYFGIGMLLYGWFSRWMGPFVAFGVMALLVLNPFLTLSARTAGPDIVSIFVLLAAVYLSIERDRPIASALTFIVAIAVRPENIIYAGVFLVYMTWAGNLSPMRSILCLAAAGALYLGLVRSSGNNGWRTLFYFTFVNKGAATGGAPRSIGLIDYARMYIGRLDRIFLGRGELPIFVLVGFGGLCLKARYHPLGDRYAHLIVIAGVIAVARMIILPTEAFRAL